jgi:hypothetical protein
MKKIVKIDLSIIIIFLILLVSSLYVMLNYLCIGCYNAPIWAGMFIYAFWASIIVLVATFFHLLIKR